MSKIMLDGYRPIEKRWAVYALDLESGEVDTHWFANQKQGVAAGPKQGAGDFRKFGRWPCRTQGFFAVYVTENSLYLWLNGKCFDVFDDDVLVKRGVDFLLRKRFRVYTKGVLEFDCRYSYLDHEDFPDKDIFWYVARSLATKEEQIRTSLIWRDVASGKSQATDEYARDLAVRVQACVDGKMGSADSMGGKCGPNVAS